MLDWIFVGVDSGGTCRALCLNSLLVVVYTSWVDILAVCCGWLSYVI